MEHTNSNLLDRVAQLTDQLFSEGLPEAHVPPASGASSLPDLIVDAPYPHSGSRERGRWLGGRAGSGSCLSHGDDPPVAVKVWSDVVQAEVWVVADDLPCDQWPTDAAVYCHAEVRLLTGVGQDALGWVHLVKVLFNARLVADEPRSRHLGMVRRE